MSDFQSTYYLRASPASGDGGMYAVFEGEENDVRVAAQTSEFVDRQKWYLELAQEEPKVYKVVNVSDIPTWLRPNAWGVSEDGLAPDSPVIATPTKERVAKWSVQPIQNGIPGAHTFLLQEPPIVGAAWYAGTNEQNQVVFKVLPLGIPDDAKPYWVLHPEGA